MKFNGQYLEQLRLAQGWSRAKLVAKLYRHSFYLGEGAIFKIERGLRQPRQVDFLVEKLAKIFGVKKEDFFKSEP